MAKEEKKPPVRITDQFRTRGAMVYDVSCNEVRLTLQVSVRKATSDLEEWHVEAFARQAPGRPTVYDSGETPRDALRAVARAWVAKGEAYGFPPLDWDAVAEVLVAVRAI